MFSKEEFKEKFQQKLKNLHGKTIDESTDRDKYNALASLIRDNITKKWVQTNNTYLKKGTKQVYYLSMEFLLGKLLKSYLINIGLRDVCEEGLKELNIDLNKLEEIEADPGLGNGGLGRLAACFLDSIASLKLPGHGSGIRYKYGFFDQKIIDGYQTELPDKWLNNGNIWEIRKADKSVIVKFYGNVESEKKDNELVFKHLDYQPVRAVPYDIPVPGYKNDTVNTLRLWSAEAVKKDFDFSLFNRGEYLKAIEHKYSVESISEILYPDDEHHLGKELRLKQQYFLVSSGIQSIVRRFKKKLGSINNLHEETAIHVNDTHPALAVPELMRILMDEEGLSWEEAWTITKNTISFTNHTTLPEALETWPIELFKNLLPRIFMIVEEINERYCQELWNRYPEDWDRISQMAIVGDGVIRMVNLAIVGSHSVNGVAKIHTEILKKQTLKNFHDYSPEIFNNKTNGVTHRRWLIQSNPELARLLNKTIGDSWIYHPEDLSRVLDYADDRDFQEEFYNVKLENKKKLAKIIKENQDINIDPNSIYDIHVKRIHGYKRQFMNALQIMDLYNRLKEEPSLEIEPRTFIFGGKAAPGYYMAKQIIKLINTMANVINKDKEVNDIIKVVFMENYRVSLAERVFPAADVSEQISTASKEASGTGNMKFMLNGALTLGTLDGANIEIKEEVGEDNIIIFGLKPEEVLEYYKSGGYSSWEIYNSNDRIKKVVNQLINGFLPVSTDEFRGLYDHLLLDNDEYFVLKDLISYSDAQMKINSLYKDKFNWRKKCIINIGSAGKFSSDRTISEYALGIWGIQPQEIKE